MTRSLFASSLFIMLSGMLYSQGCLTSATFQLKNINGGVFSNQTITLTSRVDGKAFSQKTNVSGAATFNIPCEQIYDISITNYTRKKQFLSGSEGGMHTETYSYEPDMIAKEKMFAMTDIEKKAVDEFAKTIADSIDIGYGMSRPRQIEYYVRIDLSISNVLTNKPLEEEEVTIRGEKRRKILKGKTDRNGHLIVYVVKGDNYQVDFKYHKDYISKECEYGKGISEGEMSFSYLGTKEVLRRKKIEAERIAAEEKRLKAEEKAFEDKCKSMGITVEEGRKKEVKEMIARIGDAVDLVVTKVLNRNKWTEKLIVCDLTGSMSPYAAQLAAWYQLSYKNEKNLQFVFFNDGDNKPDELKKIGSTGGIYYAESKGIDSLFNIMAKVSSRGSGGDCPENNMEALIKGVKKAKPYKELVMIADNNAPVKDISLLKEFKAPVHIILCGVYDGVLEDYLTIAWKTKGSIHTMEEDITRLATMSEGQEIQIGKNLYKIMGGNFVMVRKA